MTERQQRLMSTARTAHQQTLALERAAIEWAEAQLLEHGNRKWLPKAFWREWERRAAAMKASFARTLKAIRRCEQECQGIPDWERWSGEMETEMVEQASRRQALFVALGGHDHH